jgi:predicted kinase
MDTGVVLIAGLPGSGKTTYLSRMSQNGWVIFDDFKALAFDDCSKFRGSQKLPHLIRALLEGCRCAVADIDFCKMESREEAVQVLVASIPGVQIRWLFFENESSTCEANVQFRSSPSLARELQLIRDYSAAYHIPHGADVLPVFRSTERRITDNREPL